MFFIPAGARDTSSPGPAPLFSERADMYNTTLKKAMEQSSLAPPASDFAYMLREHGEVQVRLGSGKTYSVHLGDRGDISDDALTVVLFNGETVRICWEAVETMWTHLASEE